MKLYINEVQYKTETSTRDARLKCRIISDLAEAGNAEAIYRHGFQLFTGLWDEEQMRHDMAFDQLLPPTDDAKADPYLILSRDIGKAVKHLKMVADMPVNVSFPLRNTAQGILSYCQKNELAGFSAGHIKISYEGNLDSLDLDFDLEIMLDENAKSAYESGGGDNKIRSIELSGFVTLPDARPKITDPKKAMFKNIAVKARDRCIFQSFGAVFVYLLLSMSFYFESSRAVGWQTFGISFLYAAVLFVLPLALFAKLFNDHGVKQKVPICSCGRIHEAYEAGIQEIGGNRSAFKDPFARTPFLVKNLVCFKQLLFWLYGILTIVGLVCYFLYPDFRKLIDSSRISATLATFVLIYSFLMTSYDKKIPACLDILGAYIPWLAFLVLYFFFFVLDDADCAEEAKGYETKKELEMMLAADNYY